MNRKAISGIILTLLLTGMLTFTFNVQLVKASETIIIRADGSIDPPTAPIVRDGNLYTLTGNITCDADGIVIERDNIVLDGADHTVQGPAPYVSHCKGIDLSERNNVTIQNTEIRAFDFGIYLNYSSDISISRNDIVANNLVGLIVQSSSDNDVTTNNITGNYYGIQLSEADNNCISENQIIYNGPGFTILLSSSSNNSIFGNSVTENSWGVSLEGSSNNTVSGNNIKENLFYGIWLGGSSDNTILDNDITGNDDGIGLRESFDNTFYHNNLINNTLQVYFFIMSGFANIWDDGYPSGGNYWSDYEWRYPDAIELDGSGIWDTPYVIDANNQDNYPLMEPWTPTPPIPTTISELKIEIEELGSQGEIDNQGIVTSLIAKLNVAQKLVDSGKIDQAKTILEAFIQPVQNLSGIHITPEAADILIESAEYILSHL